MKAQAYTLDDIMLMRAVVRTLLSAETMPSLQEVPAAIVEANLQTYMLAGISADELKDRAVAATLSAVQRVQGSSVCRSG